MAKRNGFFDAQGTPPDRQYTSAEWARVHQRLWNGNGVDRQYQNAMVVTEAAPPSNSVKVDLGWIWVNGYYLEVHTTPEFVAIANGGVSHPTLPRIDLLVARCDLTSTVRNVDLFMIAGTPSATPAAPAPVRSGNIYDEPLAQVLVGAGVTTILNTNITDRRAFVGPGIVPGGQSAQSVGVSTQTDMNTGLWWSAADVMNVVAGGSVGLSTTPTTVFLGTDTPITGISIGRVGQLATFLGNAVVNGTLSAIGNVLFAGYTTVSGSNFDLTSSTTAAFLRVVGAAGAYSAMQLTSPDSTKVAFLSLGHQAGQFLGGAGDFSLYTNGAAAGRLILGANNGSALHITTGRDVNVGVNMLAGAGRFNVFPAAQTLGSGINLYNAGNSAIYSAFWQDSGARGVFSNNAGNFFWAAQSGYTTIGTLPMDTARFGVLQNSAVQAEGIQISLFGTGNVGRLFVGASNHFYLASSAAQVVLRSDLAALAPSSDVGAYLGYSDARWAIVYAAAAVLSGALQGTTATFSGAISAASYGAVNGTTGSFSGAVTAASFGAIVASSGTFFGNITTPDITATELRATGHISRNIAGTPSYGLQLDVDSAAKPTTSTWSVFSDPRAKYDDAYEPYLPGLTEILQFKPEWYTYNGKFGTPDGERGVGIRAAHLLETDAAHMVSRSRVALDDPEIDDDDIPDHIDYHALFMMLVNGMHDLHAMLQDSNRRVRALEGAVRERRN
jgi:hypothetical protein